MITEAQLAANRANSQKSTGPKTTEGKTNSSRNSFKHGLYSKQLVVGAEEAAALDELKDDLRSEHQPINETEGILVNELAEQFWRLRRARAYEARLLDSGEVLIPHLALVQRMMSSAERSFHKALTVLRQLQKDQGFVPQKQSRDREEAVGFVPQSDRNPDCQGAAKLIAESSELSANSGSRSESASASGFVSQSAQRRDLACQSTSALAREGAAPLSADRCELTAPSGFVPPPCPADEEIDPADWARAFEARHRVHTKSQS